MRTIHSRAKETGFFRKTRFLLLWYAWSLVFLQIPPPCQAAENHHQVLVLHSYHQGFPWTDNIMAGIQNTVDSAALDIELFVEYLDTKRYSKEQLFAPLECLYQEKYRNISLDVILTTDNNALEFLLRRREKLFPGIPIVFCGINNYDPALLTGRDGITGVAEEIDPKGTLELAIELHPALKTVAVVSDQTTSGQINRQRFNEIAPLFTDRLQFLDLANLTQAELIQALQQLPQDSIVFNVSFYQDRAGRTFTIEQSTELIVRHAQAPVYSLWDFTIIRGVLGGIVVNGKTQGAKAAGMAIRILQGTAASSIPGIRESPNTPMFDYRQLQRFNISESKLPPGSILLNKPVSFYEKNKVLVWQVGAGFALLFALVLFLSMNVMRHRQVEESLRRSQGELETQVQARTQELERINYELELEIHERKQAEQALRIKDYAIASSISAIALADLEGKLTYVNYSFLTMWGYDSEDEVLGKPSVSFWQMEEKAAEIVQALQQHDNWIGELTARKKDGSLFDVQLIASMVMDEHERPICMMASFVDITEGKKAEKALRESEERYRTAVETSHDGFAISRKEGVLLFVNQRFLEIFGYDSQQQVEGMSIAQLIHPKDRTRVLSTYRRRMRGDEFVPSRYEFSGLRQDGTSIPLEVSSTRTLYHGETVNFAYLRDITERKWAENALCESEERFRAVLENSLDAAYRRNLHTDTYDYLSPAITTLSGYTSDEMMYMTVERMLEHIHPDDIDGVSHVLTQSLTQGQGHYQMEYRFKHKNGQYRWWSDLFTMLVDMQGEPLFRIGSVRDITEQKQIEQALRDSEQELQDLVYIASHDLQTPIVSMVGYASNILNKYAQQLDEKGVYAVQRLKSNAERLHKLVLSLLDLSRLNTVKNPYRSFSAEEVVRNIVNDLALLYGETRAEITVESLPKIYGDEPRLTSVFRNLLTNALNYGGKYITVGCLPEQSDAGGAFFVRDDGIGIAPRNLEKIFQAGERLKKIDVDGVGMGLTFCKKVIMQHQGTIWAESEGEGKGAAFYFTVGSSFSLEREIPSKGGTTNTV